MTGPPGASGSSGTSGTGSGGNYAGSNYNIIYYDHSGTDNKGSSKSLNYDNKRNLYICSGITCKQMNTTYAQSVLSLEQYDADKAFIRFNGTYDNTDPVNSGNLSTYNGQGPVASLYTPAASNYGWLFDGMIKIQLSSISGGGVSDKWLAVYHPKYS